MSIRIERFDTLPDANVGISKLEAEGRKIIDVKIFSFTQVDKEGYPMQFPVFYVTHEKGIIVRA